MTAKIWANSGDSHLVEPDDLFEDSLPRAPSPTTTPPSTGPVCGGRAAPS